MHLRRAVPADFSGMWPIFQEVLASESTYVFTADTSEADAFAYWFGPGVTAYVAEENGAVVAMYKLVANQMGLGGHVANASFMVAARAGGRGIGRQLGLHCLQQARAAGFLAMQFNFVVSTNAVAVKLWHSLGFTIVGTLPQVFRHREFGLVDAFVMHRFLA